MFHKTILAGNVGRDPEMRYLADGTSVTNFSLAVSDGWGDNKKTIWFRVSAWRKQAEICNEFLSVGSKVLIEGRIRADENGNPRLWTRKDGSVSSSFEITANNVTFLSSKVEDEALGGRENNTYPAGGGDPDIEIDDIPFVRPILSTLDCDPIGLSPEAAHILIDFPTN